MGLRGADSALRRRHMYLGMYYNYSILGFYRGYIGIMEKKMETTLCGSRFKKSSEILHGDFQNRLTVPHISIPGTL